MLVIFILLFFLFLFLETSIVAMPLVLLLLIILAALYKELWIFPISFVAGVILDILTFQRVGISSILFLIFFGIFFLYQKRFEVQTIQFVFFFTLVTSFVYYLFSQGKFLPIEAMVSGMIGGTIFLLCRMSNQKKHAILLVIFNKISHS